MVIIGYDGALMPASTAYSILEALDTVPNVIGSAGQLHKVTTLHSLGHWQHHIEPEALDECLEHLYTLDVLAGCHKAI